MHVITWQWEQRCAMHYEVRTVVLVLRGWNCCCDPEQLIFFFSVFHLATMPTAKIIHGRKTEELNTSMQQWWKNDGKAGVLGKTPVPTLYAPQILHEHSFCHHSTTKEVFSTRGIIQKFVMWLHVLKWQKTVGLFQVVQEMEVSYDFS